MKTQYIIASIIGVVVIGGGIIWYATSSSTPVDQNTNVVAGTTTTQSQGAQTTPDVKADGSYAGSLADLSKSGKSYICSVTHNVQGISSAGTVYISGDNIKAEFTTNVPQIGTIKANMLATKDSIYSWTSLVQQGFKFARTATSTQQVGTGQASGQIIDVNQKLNYKCVAWNPSSATFAVPAGINFKTL